MGQRGEVLRGAILRQESSTPFSVTTPNTGAWIHTLARRRALRWMVAAALTSLLSPAHVKGLMKVMCRHTDTQAIKEHPLATLVLTPTAPSDRVDRDTTTITLGQTINSHVTHSTFPCDSVCPEKNAGRQSKSLRLMIFLLVLELNSQIDNCGAQRLRLRCPTIMKRCILLEENKFCCAYIPGYSR